MVARAVVGNDIIDKEISKQTSQLLFFVNFSEVLCIIDILYHYIAKASDWQVTAPGYSK